MARKTTSTPKQAKAAAPKKAAAKRPAAKKTAAKSATVITGTSGTSDGRRVFSLQVGNTFTLLSEKSGGGFVSVQQPIDADAWLEIFYWKEPQQLARPDSQFTSVKLHARVDGVEQPVLDLGSNEDGRFVRRAATLDVPATTQHVEYWFEISMSTGETVWDSNWGNNYWLDVASHASLPVEVLYDASMDSSLSVD